MIVQMQIDLNDCMVYGYIHDSVWYIIMKIIVLGDSFTFGQGCSDVQQASDKRWFVPSEFGWPSLLGKKHQTFDIVNLSHPVLDNISIV